VGELIQQFTSNFSVGRLGLGFHSDVFENLTRHPHIRAVFQDDGLISLRRCEIRGHGLEGVSPHHCALDVEQEDARRFGIADYVVLNADAL